jgi:hypothetical protein
MQTTNPALLPCPALFDVTTVAKAPPDGRIERIEWVALELAPNSRREISRGGIERLAGMLMRTGQRVPCIGHRPDQGHPKTIIYDGQRRLLAAQASGELAGADGYEGLAPVQSLIVLLFDHQPGADEIRRIQAQANQRESLSLVDSRSSCATAGKPAPGYTSTDLTTRRCKASARSCTAPSSRTSTPTPCGSTTAQCSIPPSRSSTPAPTSPQQRQLAAILGCGLERLDAELDTLAGRAKSVSRQSRIYEVTKFSLCKAVMTVG